MAIKELTSPFHLITPLGLMEAHFLITGGQDGFEWLGFIKDTGEAWCFPNKQVRLHRSISEYRYTTSDIGVTAAGKVRLANHVARTKATRQQHDTEQFPGTTVEGKARRRNPILRGKPRTRPRKKQTAA